MKGDLASYESLVVAVDFVTREEEPLTQGLRGVASQTYDTVPIGYAFDTDQAPNRRSTRRRGRTRAAGRSARTARARRSTASCPWARAACASTYTGYTLLENMLKLP
jgi:hypothetical protein